MKKVSTSGQPFDALQSVKQAALYGSYASNMLEGPFVTSFCTKAHIMLYDVTSKP